MSNIEMLDSEIEQVRHHGKEIAVMLDKCQKENEELINALSQEHDKRMECEEEITDLEGRLDIADPKWREYRHIDIGYPRIQDISRSDTIGSNAANAKVISDLRKLNLNGGKSKKKSTKKKRSKQKKTKRRHKNKKN